MFWYAFAAVGCREHSFMATIDWCRMVKLLNQPDTCPTKFSIVPIRTIMIVPLNADLLAISWLSSSEWMIPDDLTECHNDSPVVRWTFYQFGLFDSNHWTISIGRNEFRVDERLACKWWTNDGKYCLMNGKSTSEPGRRWYSLYNRLGNTECLYTSGENDVNHIQQSLSDRMDSRCSPNWSLQWRFSLCDSDRAWNVDQATCSGEITEAINFNQRGREDAFRIREVDHFSDNGASGQNSVLYTVRWMFIDFLGTQNNGQAERDNQLFAAMKNQANGLFF